MTRMLTVGCLWRGGGSDDVYPSIRLEGKWLAAIDFEIGQRVLIVVTTNSITITPVTTDGQERAQRCFELPRDARSRYTVQLELPLM
jgi:hypothetical protein